MHFILGIIKEMIDVHQPTQSAYYMISNTITFNFWKKALKFPKVKAEISSFERVPVDIGHISGWNYLHLYRYAFPDSVEKFYRFQQGLFQNLKFVPWPLDIILSFFKHEHVNNAFYLFFPSKYLYNYFEFTLRFWQCNAGQVLNQYVPSSNLH